MSIYFFNTCEKKRKRWKAKRREKERNRKRARKCFEINVFIVSAFSFSQNVGFKYLKTQKKIANISII